MSKRKHFLALGLGLLLFLTTSFLQVHRGPVYICDHNDGKGSHTEYRLEYGLPFAYLKRSMSDIECQYKYYKYPQHVYFDSFDHEVIQPYIVFDLGIWLIVSYIIIFIAVKPRSIRSEHE